MFGQGLSAEQSALKQKLLTQPPAAVIALSERSARHGKPSPIDIETVVNADFDGDGSFRYFVALFDTKRSGSSGFLRVFKEQGGEFVVAGDQDSASEVGGYDVQIELVDVNNDGIAEVKVNSMSHDGQDQYFSLFTWTGSGLHDMTGNTVGSGSLEDIDGDAILEIVASNPRNEGFDIYKLVGNTYQFLKTVKQDPSGLTGPDGNLNYVRSFCKDLDPNQFSLADIKRALGNQKEPGGEVVHLSFGKLQKVRGGPVSVNQMDSTTIMINPSLRPLRVSISSPKGRKQHDEEMKVGACHDEHGTVSVELSRSSFLRLLPRLQPTAPLAAGDKVQFRISAKLKDGTPVGAVFTAHISGDSGDR